MKTIDNGGPAFPVTTSCAPDYDGMTLRDYLAAKAMQAIMMDPEDKKHFSEYGDDWKKELSEMAYRVADAMLKAREV